jgi:hypothetical protein
VAALSLKGGAISDAAGRAAMLALPAAGSAVSLAGTANLVVHTSTASVLSIVRLDPTPTPQSLVTWLVTFSEPVSGVDSTDFGLAVTGLGGGPGIVSVSGGGSTYTVAAGTGLGTGTLGLNLVDDDSILDGFGIPLGGAGTGNGSLAGEVYVVNRTLTPAFTVASRVYDGTTPAAIMTRTLSGSIAPGDSVVLSGGAAAFADPHAGTAKIVTASSFTLTGPDAQKYVLGTASASSVADILPRPIAVSADPQQKTLGAPDPALTWQIGSGSLVAGDAFSGALAREPGEAAGDYAILSGTLSAGSDYSVGFTSARFSIVAPATRLLRVTATVASKVYDGTTAAAVALADDREPGDVIVVRHAGAAFADPNAGLRKPVAIGGLLIEGPDAGKYHLASTSLTATADIAPRPVHVAIVPARKTYGAAEPVLRAKMSPASLLGGDVFTGSPRRQAGEHVGRYSITAGTLTAGPNYTLLVTPGVLHIEPRPILVAADAQIKSVGEEDPPLTYHLEGGSLVGYDRFSGQLARVPGETVGSYTIVLGTLTAGPDYALSFIESALVIVPASERPARPPRPGSAPLASQPSPPARGRDCGTAHRLDVWTVILTSLTTRAKIAGDR